MKEEKDPNDDIGEDDDELEEKEESNDKNQNNCIIFKAYIYFCSNLGEVANKSKSS